MATPWVDRIKQIFRLPDQADEIVYPAQTAKQRAWQMIKESWHIRAQIADADEHSTVRMEVGAYVSMPAKLAKEMLNDILDEEAHIRKYKE